MSETSDQLKARFTTGHVVNQSDMSAMVEALAVTSSTKETLKSYFETGDKPTQAQFYELIDAIFAQQKTDMNWVDATSYANTKYETTANVPWSNSAAATFDGQTNSILQCNVMSNTSSPGRELINLFGHVISALGSIVQVRFVLKLKLAQNAYSYVSPFAGELNYTVTMPYMYSQTSFIDIYSTRADLQNLGSMQHPIGACNQGEFGYYPFPQLYLFCIPYILVYDNLNRMAIGATFLIMDPLKQSMAFDFVQDAGDFNFSFDVISKLTKVEVLTQDATTISVG